VHASATALRARNCGPSHADAAYDAFLKPSARSGRCVCMDGTKSEESFDDPIQMDVAIMSAIRTTVSSLTLRVSRTRSTLRCRQSAGAPRLGPLSLADVAPGDTPFEQDFMSADRPKLPTAPATPNRPIVIQTGRSPGLSCARGSSRVFGLPVEPFLEQTAAANLGRAKIDRGRDIVEEIVIPDCGVQFCCLDDAQRLRAELPRIMSARRHPLEQWVISLTDDSGLDGRERRELASQGVSVLEHGASTDRLKDDAHEFVRRFKWVVSRFVEFAASNSPPSAVSGSRPARHDATDPVQIFHRVGANRYELSGLRTGSVRDQILRAEMLTRSLVDCGSVGEGRALLVVGGGGAGVAAALCAICHGVPVTMIERERAPFVTQLGVATRHLDPTEFDWPHAHWDASCSSKLHALPYQAGRANQLALEWTALLYACCQPDASGLLPPHTATLTIHAQVDARSLNIHDDHEGRVVIEWPPDWPGSTRVFGAAISCIGFSAERVGLPSSASGHYRGFPFWSTDPYERADLGLRGAGRPSLNALVTGGGDGAQQDFLRLLTGMFGKELYRRIVSQGFFDGLDVAPIALADDAFRRDAQWKPTSERSLRGSRRRFEIYSEIVHAEFLRHSEAEICSLARYVLRSGWGVSCDVTWIVGQASPGHCYGLNLLLSLVVARLHAYVTDRRVIQERGREAESSPLDRPVLMFGTKLVDVLPSDGHTCTSPESCHGRPHHVLASINGARHWLGDFDVVVIRHGVEHQPLFGLAPVAEQILPFDEF
jgi:hypothetical protein